MISIHFGVARVMKMKKIVRQLVKIKTSKSREFIIWKVVSSIPKSNSNSQVDHINIGIKNFDFNNQEIKFKKIKHVNLLKLVTHL